MTSTTQTSTASWRRRAASGVWRWRREIVAATGLVATGGLPLLVPAGRRRVRQTIRHARTRQLLGKAFRELRLGNVSGQVPRIVRIVETPAGERVHLRVQPGMWKDVLEVRGEAIAAAVRSSSARFEKDPDDSSRVTIDVIRRDPLRDVEIPWADLMRPVLSIWDPVHLGMTELGEQVYLDLAERNVLIGGNPGSGKSTLLRTIASHVAKSPDAHLALIDPNQVQFGPWRDRALAYAGENQTDALEVLLLVQAEMQRRLNRLLKLPGCPDKVTREIAAGEGMDPLVLMCDELAYHTSIAPNPDMRGRFAAIQRDIAARGRAAGIIPILAAQRPTDKVVPRDLAELFAVRIAFRVAGPGSSDVILGDGRAKQGFDASEIALESRGVGLILAEDGRPRKFKGARIPTEAIADLSVTTVANKPRHLSVVPDRAAQAA